MTEHEQMRRSLWVGVATAVAGGVTTLDKPSPAAWADHVLADFDKRFNDATPPPPGAAPSIIRGFYMTADEIAAFRSVSENAIDPARMTPYRSEQQQRLVLGMYESRQIMNARMPFAIEASTNSHYRVSEAPAEVWP